LINIFMYVIDFIMCKRKGELSGFVRLLSCYTPVAGRAIYIYTTAIQLLNEMYIQGSSDYLAPSFDQR